MMSDEDGEILAIIARELKIRPELLRSDYTLEDLGIDSLAAAEILIAVEQQLGVSIGTAQIVENVDRDTQLSELTRLIRAAVESEQGDRHGMG